jgi:uncharacterized protein YjbJ (UPF0337 family)
MAHRLRQNLTPRYVAGRMRRVIVNWNRIEHDWQQYRLCAKRRWDRLSENELMQINGKRDELCAKIQEAYGIRRPEAELQIADWAYELDEPMRGEQHDAVQSQSQTLH